MSLTEYRQKRHFKKTTEPPGKKSEQQSHMFVVQKHFASHLHFDFRLELNGVLKSWAVPKGPPLKPKEKRLAVEVEDHPVSYATFEGTIPKGQYGAGKVEIWDKGVWKTAGNANAQLKKGHLEFELQGGKLSGHWMLVRMQMAAKKANWLLIKRTDNMAIPHASSMEEIPLDKIKPSKMIRFVVPQLCTLAAVAPSSSEWLHEIKLDGYRTFCRSDGDKITMLTRSGLDWTHKYQLLAAYCKKLKAKSFLLDGEVVWIDEQGITRFDELQNALQEHKTPELAYYVFDLLFLNGKDIREMPLLQRKTLLAELITKSNIKKIIYSEHQFADGKATFNSACQLGLEGIICKKAFAPYVSGRSSDWLKVKCNHVQEFIICGYTVQANGISLAALLLGEMSKAGKLIYVGKVGTGYNQRNLPVLMKKLHAKKAKASPFDEKVPTVKNVIWLKPTLVANIEFGSWTEDHILRHAAFKGLRDDKAAKEVIQEIVSTNDIRLTHPEKIIFPHDKISKLDLVNYYRSVESLILPHIKNRPLSLLRCPAGQGKACFFQKHIDGEAVIAVNTLEELLNLIQINALELHAWNCHVNKIDNPDLIVFDLDPDPTVKWPQVKKAAEDLKDILDRLNLRSFLKVSGNKGLHIHVPIQPDYSWDEVKDFSKSICKQLVEDNPLKYTINLLKKNRKNKIFLDYLRNGYGATAVLPFSIRNNPKATIAMPISWDSLKTLKGPNLFTVKNFQGKWSKKNDPWPEYHAIRQKLLVLEAARKINRRKS